MKQTSVTEIGSRLDATRPSLEWLDEIDRRAAVYLELDPERTGAPMLKLARENIMLARRATDADSAVVMALAALQAVWQAEMIEGRLMIDSGVTSYRRSQAANARSSGNSEREYEQWRQLAEEIRKRATRKLTKKEIAERIAKEIEPDPERAKKRANTIRRYI